MIYSMTGYGKAEAQLRDKNILLEIKSLNSKNLDISVRLPNEIREIELGLRKIISENLLRGKIDLFVTIEDCSNNQSKSINSTVVNDYINQLTKWCTRGMEVGLNLGAVYGFPRGGLPIAVSLSHRLGSG